MKGCWSIAERSLDSTYTRTIDMTEFESPWKVGGMSSKNHEKSMKSS
jgi:hypothetical protein